MAQIPSRGVDQFNLRLPDGLRDRIKAHAGANMRSMNSELILVLERAFPAPTAADTAAEAAGASPAKAIPAACDPDTAVDAAG